MSKRDVISWNSIISGHCNDPYAVAYFQQMEKSDLLPDSVTFISVLSACANLGFVEEGWRLFVEMQNKCRIIPCIEHFACMVNIFGRAGLITEAYEMIVQKMVSNASPTVLGALLYAFSLHGNVDVGEITAKKLFELEPDNAHNFELLMMIYGKAGRWADIEKAIRLMVARGFSAAHNIGLEDALVFQQVTDSEFQESSISSMPSPFPISIEVEKYNAVSNDALQRARSLLGDRELDSSVNEGSSEICKSQKRISCILQVPSRNKERDPPIITIRERMEGTKLEVVETKVMARTEVGEQVQVVPRVPILGGSTTGRVTMAALPLRPGFKDVPGT
ncbi:hypothetical protein GIB67_011464 [Kingdonia uniflora]|uniref:Pentatricopeptide repeat-containing protein n=1 Tax=Kingdonia uniflora TaxID=39325 RepID=A0A7J7NLJ2_9MAGN|nr:hypothetical protein GIB67_011464 [Kingdonia uniflora]